MIYDYLNIIIYTFVLLFFFYGAGDNPDLHVQTHTFPTRRSSDQLHENPPETPHDAPPQSTARDAVRKIFNEGTFNEENVLQRYASIKTLENDFLAEFRPAVKQLPDSEQKKEYRRSEEHTSELKSLMRISYAVFCLTKKNNNINQRH